MATGHNDLVVRVAKRIAMARRERGLSQESFAALLGIAVKNLQRIESGKQNLSLATLDRICATLEISAESLLAGVTPPAQRPTLPHALERLSAAGYPVRAATERGRRPAHAVPVTTLRAAAGALGGAARAVEVIGWVVLSRTARPPEGQFVAQVSGRSMEPRIPGGSLCLFEPARPPPLRDRILLVAHESLADGELGGPYALKRVKSTRKIAGGVTRVVLESINTEFEPIVIEARGDELRIIAELVRVLVTA